MTEGPNQLNRWTSIVALLGSILALGVTFGIQQGRIDDNTQDIAELKRDGRDTATTLNEIAIRVERIDTRLSILLPDSAVARVRETQR